MFGEQSDKMFGVNTKSIQQFLEKNSIQIRPNAGYGLWLMYLLPLTILVSSISHPLITTSTYKLSSIFSFGLICSSSEFIAKISKNKKLDCFSFWQMTFTSITAILFRICLHEEIVFSIYSAIFSIILYQNLYLNVLKKMPLCFTLGEAALCSQSYILLLYFTSLNIVDKIIKPTNNVIQMSTFTIQLGLLALSILVIMLDKFRISTPFKFYTVTASTFILLVLLPLQIIFRRNPLLWILSLFWEDLQQNKVILYWFFCSLIAVIAVNQRIKKAKKATTSVRKIFHFLIIAVFLPGLLYNCSLLYLASGAVLGIFFMLEILRVVNVPPLAQSLQNGLIIFGDEKDVGIVAFTPIYLLAGCALPLWLHPAPCDVTNSAIFNMLPLLSGVLTTGVGDTAASIVGSNFGKHYWSGSKKSIEGSIACVASQLLAIFIFHGLDFIKLNLLVDYIKVIAAVIITSLIEAKTDQVDNLVLPFIMYIIFIV